MWSQIGDKIAMLVHKVTLKKKFKKVKPQKNLKLESTIFFQGHLWTNIAILSPI